jgi:hypothetical protein
MSLVRSQHEDGIAHITLTNAPANCYSHEMMTELDAAIIAARFDPEVHVILLDSEGSKFFCAGADIAMLKGADPYFKYNFCLHANETMSRLEQTPNANERPERPAWSPASSPKRPCPRPHRQGRLGQMWPPRGQARSAPRHRWHPASGSNRRQSSSHRADGRRGDFRLHPRRRVGPLQPGLGVGGLNPIRLPAPWG